MVTLHRSLQLVLSKTFRIGDTTIPYIYILAIWSLWIEGSTPQYGTWFVDMDVDVDSTHKFRWSHCGNMSIHDWTRRHIMTCKWWPCHGLITMFGNWHMPLNTIAGMLRILHPLPTCGRAPRIHYLVHLQAQSVKLGRACPSLQARASGWDIAWMVGATSSPVSCFGSSGMPVRVNV